MKVALLGNMNNNHFALVRYLRDRGVNASLILFNDTPDLFQPFTDTFDLDFMSYTRQVAWGSGGEFSKVSSDQVAKDLQPFDVLIGTGLAAAYCNKAGRTLDIFVPYGGDVLIESHYRIVSPQRLRSIWASVFHQRRGLRDCRIVHTTLGTEQYEGLYRALCPGSTRWSEGVPMVYGPAYSEAALEVGRHRSHWWHEFARVRAANSLVVVYHGRHVWGTANDPEDKGIDILLRGWARFRQARPDISSALMTCHYGRDVDRSKALIEELGIGDSIVWLPKMYRKDLMAGLSAADIVCGHFRYSWAASGVLYEGLISGKPILSYRDDAIYTKQDRSLYPIMNANDPESICARLQDYVQRRDEFRELGEAGRRWYEIEVVGAALPRYLRYFEERSH